MAEGKKMITYYPEERDGYVEVWADCSPPPKGLRYQILHEQWDTRHDPITRYIYSWKPVTETVEIRG